MVAINYDAEPGRPDVMTDPLLMALCRGADTPPSRPQPAAGVPVCGRYGPTHSQSLEKLFLGVPHLRVVAGSLVHHPAGVPRAAGAGPPGSAHRAPAAVSAAPDAARGEADRG